MNVHKNARLTPIGRERLVRLVESRQTPKAVAQAAGVCPRTVRKWVDRYRREGIAGLRDRSSRPHRLHRPTPDALVEQVEALRRQRHTGKQIAAELRLSPATVSRILRRLGLNRIAALEPCEPVRRYERASWWDDPHRHQEARQDRWYRPSHHRWSQRSEQQEIAGRRLGWEFVHVAIDDNSRIAFAKVMPNERKRSATAFLKATLAYYESLSVRVERVMTDNGSCYKSFAFRRACKRFGLRHIRTKPYMPKTNGKAERFIQTCLGEWAYAQAFHHTERRGTAVLAAPLQLAQTSCRDRC
jgi:transposase InsO family protein